MWIYPYPRKSVDMDVDIDEKYHVHGYSYVKRMRGRTQQLCGNSDVCSLIYIRATLC